MGRLIAIKRILVSLLFISTPTLAYEKPHSLEIAYDWGQLNDKSIDDVGDISTDHYSISYSYNFTRVFAVSAGYLKGDSENARSVLSEVVISMVTFGILQLTEIEYRAYSLGAKFQIPLSQRHNLYIDINGYQYDFDKEMSVFKIDDAMITIDDDGTDFGVSAGWRVRHDNGFGVRVGVDYLRMGSDVDIGGIGAGVSFSF